MNAIRRSICACILALPAFAHAGSPQPSMEPLANSWPTYSGDYSGQRYSRLSQVGRDNVRNLTLAWATRLTGGTDSGAGGMFAPPSPPQIVGGETAEAVVTGGLFSSALPISVRGAILEVNGVLYASAPDNA